MRCCNKGENHHKPEEENMKKPVDRFTVTFSLDKFLTYALVGLIIITLVVGYTVVKNKNRTKPNVQGVSTQNSPTNNQADDMSLHHGGGNKKFEPLPQGSIAPDFSLPSTSGKTISLADYKGKHVLLFFNEGVMCSPCWQEISRLERFKDDFAKLNAVIIPISVDDQKTWNPILKEERITTPILIDTDRKVTAMYKALGTPSSMHNDRAGHTYVHIDTQGKIYSSADFPNMNVLTSVLLEQIKQTQNPNESTKG